MVDPVAVSIAVVFVVVVAIAHFAPGTERTTPEDISQEVLDQRAESLPETDFPEPMSRAIGGGTLAGGAAGEAGGGELEGTESADAPAADEGPNPAAIPDEEAEVFDVEFEKQGETVEVPENQTLLEAGEEQGWDMPYACRQGQCLSCGGHVTNGPSEDYIFHDNQEMLDEDEIGEGYTLTCVGYPTADLSLETGEQP